MQFYFALVESGETVFSQDYARTDWTVMSFSRRHQEQEFAALQLEIKNPGVGLLAGPTWLWFSVRPVGSPVAIPLFFGRIVGVPSSILQEAVTVELIARPADFVAQKQAVTDALRVLPWFDEVFIDPLRRDDPDIVLEAYSKRIHIDPVTHVVGVSDILIGEDALAEFSAHEMLYDGFDLALASDIPLRSVAVDALLSWTQLAQGSVDLSSYLIANWPKSVAGNYITSFTLRETNWPQPGGAIGDNWRVEASSCVLLYGLDVLHVAGDDSKIIKWWDGVTTNIDISTSDDYLAKIPPGSIAVPSFMTDETLRVTYKDDGAGGKDLATWSYSLNHTDGIIPVAYMVPTLRAAYDAARPCEERVTFTLKADVQPLVTMPGEDEALRLDNIRSVNLSDPIDESSDAVVPIGDPRRRSYLLTERGQLSLVHLLLLARNHLLRRARAVEVTFAPTLDRLFDIGLKKNARVYDPRIPGGQADGKIVEWDFGVNGDSGAVELTVTMACAVGNGGDIEISAGEPTWIEDDYIEDDYQERTGRVVSFNSDIGYEQPLFNPQDDGIDFIGGVTVDSAVEQALDVVNPEATQRPILQAAIEEWNRTNGGIIGLTKEQRQELVQARADAMNAVLAEIETVATFKLKSMRNAFSSPYPITTSELKIPNMINLSGGVSA